MNFQHKDFKLGIIGGGQLGRMLIQAGIDLNINFSILDNDDNAPCKDLVSDLTNYTLGISPIMTIWMSNSVNIFAYINFVVFCNRYGFYI